MEQLILEECFVVGFSVFSHQFYSISKIQNQIETRHAKVKANVRVVYRNFV
jgi:hypothetical protein